MFSEQLLYRQYTRLNSAYWHFAFKAKIGIYYFPLASRLWSNWYADQPSFPHDAFLISLIMIKANIQLWDYKRLVALSSWKVGIFFLHFLLALSFIHVIGLSYYKTNHSCTSFFCEDSCFFLYKMSPFFKHQQKYHCIIHWFFFYFLRPNFRCFSNFVLKL